MALNQNAYSIRVSVDHVLELTHYGIRSEYIFRPCSECYMFRLLKVVMGYGNMHKLCPFPNLEIYYLAVTIANKAWDTF